MTDPRYERFANVQMPRWYRITAWVIRVIGFLVFLASAWRMTHQEASPSAWPMGGVFIGVLLLAGPSLPKAFIEQRNRNRGIRDGSFKEFLEEQQRKEK